MLKRKNFKKIVLTILIFIFLGTLLTTLSGCDKVKQFFSEKYSNIKDEKLSSKSSELQENGITKENTKPTSDFQSDKIQDEKDLKSSDSAENNSANSTDTTSKPKSNSYTKLNSEYIYRPGPYSPSIDLQQKENTNKINDLELQRKYFVFGVENFEEKKYIIAEFYLNKIKDTYKILADHVFYYLAKSLLMQKKYDLAEEYYIKLRINYPDSIFAEKANLEYADLFFIQENYSTAQIQYENFIKNFPNSELIPYSLFQLALCMERNFKFQGAFENYKKVWIEYPENEFADLSLKKIEELVSNKNISPFIPTNDEIYSRGEKFFSLYRYESAIAEFKKILNIAEMEKSNILPELYAKTLFKTGMCYYNLRDYKTSKDYLLLCYEKFPSGSFADASLYFLGRVESNLDRNDEAIKYYEKVAKNFSSSSYADDALYRIGRIYFLRDEIDKAKSFYEKIINNYPNGDKVSDAYWELGLIQYKGNDYSSSKNTFAGMASKFKGSQISTTALFWQAKSCQKLGENELAVNIFKEILSNKNYSYYSFASINELEKMNIDTSSLILNINKSLNPDNPEINNLLPEVYKNLEISNENSDNENNENDENINYSHTDKAKELLFLKFYISADKEITAASNEFEDDNIGILQISTLYLKAKDYINSQKIISKYYSKLNESLTSPYWDYFYYLLYPYGFKEYVDLYSSEFNIDSLFILAVIREESRFNPNAGSYAGALGLMQIIPSTAKSIAKELSIKNFSNDMLFNPEINIRMGTYYLKKQLDNFNSNYYFASGAYNGGPGAMKKWISQWGDKEIDEFIEYIPYDETRNYIKKVMGSYYLYKLLFEN